MSDRQRALQGMEARLHEHAAEVGPKFTSTNECHRLEAQFDLAAGALLSGLTNVVTICSGLCELNGHFRGLGVSEGNRSLGHSDGRNWPYLLIGSLGRRLRTGHLVEYPPTAGRAAGRPTPCSARCSTPSATSATTSLLKAD